MSSRHPLLVAFVAAVLGMWIGYTFATLLLEAPPAEASAADGLVVPSPSAPARTSAPAELREAPASGAMRTAMTEPIEALAPAVSEGELRRALANVEPVAAPTPTGSGTITGLVRYEDGAPVPGAVVVSRLLTGSRMHDPASVGTGAPPDRSLEEYCREQARTWAKERDGRRRAVTGADGTFALTGLPRDQRYGLTAHVEGYVVESDGTSLPVSPGQRVPFRARKVHEIPVRLVRTDGQPVPDGAVKVVRGNTHTVYSWSAAAPNLRLVAGRVGIQGYSGIRDTRQGRNGMDADLASEETSLDVRQQASTPLELVLKGRVGIRGRVIDEFGAGLAGMLVRVLAMPAGGEVDEGALAKSSLCESLYGDRFQFLDLAPGTYGVGLGTWGEGLYAHETVTVGEGVQDVTLVIPAPDPERHLVLHALGPAGSPLQDLDFSWSWRHEGGGGSRGIRGRLGSDGSWWLRPEEGYFEPWGKDTSYALRVTHSQLGVREVQLAEGQLEVTVAFEEPTSLQVTVIGYAGSGLEGRLQVRLVSVSEDMSTPEYRMGSWRRGQGILSPTGTTRFSGLPPGRWRANLTVGTEEWGRRTVDSKEVLLTAGEKRISLRAPALYDLTVIAPGRKKGSWIQLRPTDPGLRGERMYGHVDENERVVLEDVPAGTYELTGSGVREPVPVTVPCGDIYLEAE